MNKFYYSQNGVNLTKSFEQCRLKAYWDGTYLDKEKTKKRWSIGWGHTDLSITESTTWTQQQSDNTFILDLTRFVIAINKLIKYDKLTQNQFDACVDFAYNIGEGESGFGGSTLLEKLNNGDIQVAADEFPRWSHVDGKVNTRLLERRIAERNLFLS